MKVELLQSSSKIIVIRLSFPELIVPSWTLAGLGFLLLVCAFLGLFTSPVASFLSLEPNNISVILATYSLGLITVLGSIFTFFKSQTSTQI